MKFYEKEPKVILQKNDNFEYRNFTCVMKNSWMYNKYHHKGVKVVDFIPKAKKELQNVMQIIE